ncbi:MAG: hypothetical protein A2758_02965 [Candidatus Zambryskibacteria bacterium RIFCSPHIGHO2_01_FULL_49_18]|uniref:Uncharacterized protein n=1 Tax=Candidatus Zambryskibacteria bacterium RIFCSPHIGHO2_01_FULL_49_18 TaxID=1802740 RepID=A0A1G2T2B8_9BACT|nr:MAG: hypothetical protein A2758_02965 [Candidatus Zambryskibacteria bacterium RIFCSPHIGHO2_01_FULL_49_18]
MKEEVLSMLKRVLYVLGGLVFIALAVMTFRTGSQRWDEAMAEAKVRCADLTVRKDRTVEQCLTYMRSYYHINSRLPQFGFGAVVSAQEKKSVFVSEPSTVHLPEDEVFVALGQKLNGELTYITEHCASHCRPRRLTIWRMGGANPPGRWEALYYIQEH